MTEKLIPDRVRVKVVDVPVIPKLLEKKSYDDTPQCLWPEEVSASIRDQEVSFNVGLLGIAHTHGGLRNHSRRAMGARMVFGPPTEDGNLGYFSYDPTHCDDRNLQARLTLLSPTKDLVISEVDHPREGQQMFEFSGGAGTAVFVARRLNTAWVVQLSSDRE